MKLPKSLRDLVESAESLVYIEDLSSKRGLLQTINPMVKLIVVVFMIVTSLFLSSLSYLILICAVPLILILTSKVPLKKFASKTAFIPAFAAIISLPVLFSASGQPILTINMSALNLKVTLEGLQRFLLFTVRVWFCVASLSLLMLSTGFDRMLKLLSSLKVPPVVVQMFSLAYRYFFVSVHEAQSVLMAKESRTYIRRRTINFQVLKDLGSVLAALFIRTYERSERVYMAMKSRGFEIESNSKSSIPKLHFRDFLFAGTTITAVGLIFLL
jgi:cobalt/nickel transport system permease protein